jgi:hypothetical protein
VNGRFLSRLWHDASLVVICSVVFAAVVLFFIFFLAARV